MAIKMTLCHVISKNRILLKLASRGISKGKWNGPGGKVEANETPVDGAIRETREETGLRMLKPFYHGRLYFYLNGSRRVTIVGYLFSSHRFRGRLRQSEEGKVKWSDVRDIPLGKM